MSEHSMSSNDSEWERMNGCSPESGRKIERLEVELKELKEHMLKKDREISALAWQNMAQERENAALRSKIENQLTFSPQRWMKEQMQDVEQSFLNLNEKTMKIYKKIWEREKTKAQATSPADRKAIAEEIQTLEDLCEEISSDVQKNNEEYAEKITNHLNTIESSPAQPTQSAVNKESVAVQSFLGTYTLQENEKVPYAKYPPMNKDPYRTIAIIKADVEEKYQICYKLDSGKELQSFWWIPDDVERAGRRAWIYENKLSYCTSGSVTLFELTDSVLKVNGFTFTRV